MTSQYRALYFRCQIPMPPLENGDRFYTTLIIEPGTATADYVVTRRGEFYQVTHPQFASAVEIHASNVIAAHLTVEGK